MLPSPRSMPVCAYWRPPNGAVDLDAGFFLVCRGVQAGLGFVSAAGVLPNVGIRALLSICGIGCIHAAGAGT